VSPFELESQAASERGWTAGVRVPADSAYFDGHFPARPVLPGVAQLQIVGECAAALLPGAPTVARVRHARFLAPVLPGERLAVDLWRTGDCVAFELAGPRGLVARGELELAGGERAER
jgi:3-hydroxymyristoyl/3-hydroxydecanoyl-(acyl carrier protein) dehydratase